MCMPCNQNPCFALWIDCTALRGSRTSGAPPPPLPPGIPWAFWTHWHERPSSEWGICELYLGWVVNSNLKCQVYTSSCLPEYSCFLVHGRVKGKNATFVSVWLTKKGLCYSASPLLVQSWSLRSLSCRVAWQRAEGAGLVYPSSCRSLISQKQVHTCKLTRFLSSWDEDNLCNNSMKILLILLVLFSVLKQMGLLGVFQKLIASKSNDHEGFYLLGSMVEHFEPWVN